MSRVLGTAWAAALLACGCAATEPSTEPGKGSGAAYAPMVDMQGVVPAVFASDVEACRSAAQMVRVIDIKTNGEMDPLLLGIGMVVPFGLVGITAISAISTAMRDDTNQVSKPAEPKLQQSVLVNCMARKGYRNLDPNVTVTTFAPPRLEPARRTGVDAYVVEQFAKAHSCSVSPRPVLESKGAGFERYSVACADGGHITVHCEFGNCAQQQQIASGS